MEREKLIKSISAIVGLHGNEESMQKYVKGQSKEYRELFKEQLGIF
tara:strand:- start:1916 stop:2053 length:138 start_codon:yes stop_codon:yes gene_type:complete